MFDLGAIVARVTADTTNFTMGMERVKAAGASAGTSLAGVGTAIGKAGDAIMPFSIGAAAALGLSAKAAMDFEASMELVHTQAGASQKEVDTLKEKVMGLSEAVGIGPNELAKGLFYVESAGFRGAAAMDVLKYAAEGAKVGQADLAQTANALTSVMNSQIEGAGNAATTMGTLNAIVGAGKMKFDDLNGAISTGFLATAKTFGISLSSVGSALDVLTNNGMNAESAATRLRMAITLMAVPTNKAATVLQGMGFSADEVTANTGKMTAMLQQAHVTTDQLATDLQKPNGFGVAIQDLKTHLTDAGLSGTAAAAAISDAFGGGRSAGPILTMVQDTKGLNGAFATVTKTSGNFGEAWAATEKTSAAHVEDFKAALQRLEREIGVNVLPVLTKIADSLSGVADAFGKLPSGVQQGILIFLTIVAVAGPAAKAIEAVTKAVGFLKVMLVGGELSQGIGGLAGALMALGVAGVASAIGLGIVVGLTAAAVILIATHWKAFARELGEDARVIGDAMKLIFDALNPLNWGSVKSDWARLGKDLDTALADNMLGNSDKPSNAGKTVLDNTSQAMATKSGLFGGIGKALIDASKQGMDSKSGEHKQTAADIAQQTSNLMNGYQGSFHGTGQNLGGASAQGLSSKQGDNHSAGSSLGKSAKDGADGHSRDMNKVGSNLGEALKTGLLGWLVDVAKAGADLATAAIKAAKKAAGIQSPSRVMMEVGKNIGQGFVDGVNGMQNMAQEAMQNLVGVANIGTPSFSAGMVGGGGAAGSPITTVTINGNIILDSQVKADNFLRQLTLNDQYAALGLTG